MWAELAANAGLFLSAFLSATFLPGASEATLLALAQQPFNIFFLWLSATVGNTLGSLFNWWLGRYVLHFEGKKWFPFKREKLVRSQQWFERYGYASMLLAWAPIIGDGLTFIAGIMRMNMWWFLLLVSIGKGIRFAVILGLLSFVME